MNNDTILKNILDNWKEVEELTTEEMFVLYNAFKKEVAEILEKTTSYDDTKYMYHSEDGEIIEKYEAVLETFIKRITEHCRKKSCYYVEKLARKFLQGDALYEFIKEEGYPTMTEDCFWELDDIKYVLQEIVKSESYTSELQILCNDFEIVKDFVRDMYSDNQEVIDFCWKKDLFIFER